MELVVAILFGILFFYRERLDNTVQFKMNIEKENYTLFISIFYLIQFMLFLAIIETLKVKNNLIIENLYMLFYSMCNIAIVLGFIYFLKEAHEKTISFKEFSLGLVVVCLSFAMKVFASLEFLLNASNMSELRQFITFLFFSLFWLVNNYLFNKVLKENIKCKKCNLNLKN